MVWADSRPVEPVAPALEPSIHEISPSFCNIYAEAIKAEQFKLMQICGVGYRKAIEFLIKDFAIRSQPTERAVIEKTPLGQCIEKYVVDSKIKEVAKRATWLGNDETHYQRRWIHKNLNDLKIMIKLVLHWIDAEYLTAEALKSMTSTSTQ